MKTKDVKEEFSKSILKLLNASGVGSLPINSETQTFVESLIVTACCGKTYKNFLEGKTLQIKVSRLNKAIDGIQVDLEITFNIDGFKEHTQYTFECMYPTNNRRLA